MLLVAGSPSRKSAKSLPPLGTGPAVCAPVKVNEPRALLWEMGLFCCRLKSTPKVRLCLPFIQITLSPARPFWERPIEVLPSLRPAMLLPPEKLRLGGPQKLGVWSLPAMPSWPDRFARLAQYGVLVEVLRLKL